MKEYMTLIPEELDQLVDGVVQPSEGTLQTMDIVVLTFVGSHVVFHKDDILPFEVVYNAGLSFAGLPCSFEKEVRM